jgi:hypothetical protein
VLGPLCSTLGRCEMPWPRLLRFRFSLRALLVFITLFAIWGGYHANRGWKERRAEQVLQTKAQASFQYGHRRDVSNPLLAAAAGYEWIVRQLSLERYITRASVGSSLELEIVEALRCLPHLASLDLGPRGLSMREWESRGGKPIQLARVALQTGAIEQVLAPHAIREMHINGYMLSDDDCDTVARHQSIEDLTLIDTSLSSKGLKSLLMMPHLRWISIANSDVIDIEVEVQEGSPTVKRIMIVHTALRGDVGSIIASCHNLRHLHAVGRSIDDRFVAGLRQHPSLVELRLPDASVSDACIPAIQEMPSLRTVSLPRDEISPQAIENLRRARPELNVIVRP